MKLEEIKNKTNEAVSYLVAALESGESEVLTQYLNAMARFHHYSFGNIMLIARQKPQATNVAGIRTWNSLGRFVKRGEKGILILAPMVGYHKSRQNEVATEIDTDNAADERRPEPQLVGLPAALPVSTTSQSSWLWESLAPSFNRPARRYNPSHTVSESAVSRKVDLLLTRLKKLYLKGKLLDVPHPFEEELGWLVRTNHRLVLESISRTEREEIASENLDPTEIHTYSDELRRAANNLALVGLVTRLHHWVNVFVEELPKQSAKEKSAKETPLVKNLTTLNAALERTESSPFPIDFFENLVAVRDAIIHADAKSEWTYRDKKRQVSERYANTASGEVDFTETHLLEAIENSVKQVKWYDDQLDALQGTELGPH